MNNSVINFRRIKLISFLILIIAGNNFSQESNFFYSGDWTLTDELPSVKITATPFSSHKFIAIRAYDQNINKAFLQVVADGVPLEPFIDATTAVVYAKDLTLRLSSKIPYTNIPNGYPLPLYQGIRGEWRVINENNVSSYTFSNFITAFGRSLITDTPFNQELIFGTAISAPNCVNPHYTLEVDGKPIKDEKGNVAKYTPWSNIYISGKKIVFTMNGSCSPNNMPRTNGSLKLRTAP